MQKFTLIFCLSFLVPIFSLKAQEVFFETSPGDNGREGAVKAYGRGTLNKTMELDKIKGSIYWNSEWQLATLYGENKREKWVCKTKINLYDNAIHFLDRRGEELLADNGLISRIVFHSNNDINSNTGEFFYTKDDLVILKLGKPMYMQVLNKGDYQLLKYQQTKLKSADSLYGTLKRYYFEVESQYYLKKKSTIEYIKKLTPELIMVNLPSSSEYLDFIKNNKINLKKVEDVISFLNYYNTAISTKQL